MQNLITKVTWIVAASHSHVKIFLYGGRNKPLHLVQEMIHPEGRLKGHEIYADQPGRSFSNASATRHSYSSEVDVVEKMAMDFAAQVSDYLAYEVAKNRFDSLILIANPKHLGRLRSALPKSLLSRVNTTLSKNFVEASEKTLKAEVDEAILPDFAA